MKKFDIDEFINRVNSIKIDESVQMFHKEFDSKIAEADVKKFIETAKKMNNETFNKKIAEIDGMRFEKIMSKANVKDFIEIIKKMHDVEVLTGDKKDELINDYLQKMEDLLIVKKRENYQDTVSFLKDNLDRNVKYIVNVRFTDEERNIKENEYSGNEEVDKNSLEYKSMTRKTAIGAKPGQYVQGRIVYSNVSNSLLGDHETTHAARNEIFNENGENIEPVDYIDGFMAVNNTFAFLKQFQKTTATAGYDWTEIDEKGRMSGEEDGPEPQQFEKEMSDLMEICTESIAGLMNNRDEVYLKKFENFWVPTEKMPMAAIEFHRNARDLLIMAIGSDDFIFDMLEKDRSGAIKKLNEKMATYKDGGSIEEYMKIAGERAKCEGKIQCNKEADFVQERRDEYLQVLKNGVSNDDYARVFSEYEKCQKVIENGEEEKYVEGRMNEYLQKMENYATDLFLKRMEKCQDKEQIEYFKSRLQTQEAKDRVNAVRSKKSTYSLGKESLTEQKDIDAKDKMLKKLLNRSKQIEEAKEGKSQGG